ncbi:MAG: hypothetical protein ABJJ08_10685, partial [Nonlabens ulvanivorans]
MKLKLLSLLFFLLNTGVFISNAQQNNVSIDINWPSWSGDNQIEIFDPSNNLIATYCDPARCFNGTNGNYNTTVSLGCLAVANNYR